MAFINEHAARLRDPREFVGFNSDDGAFGDGVRVIYGIDAAGKPSMQSIRFDKNKWTEVEARAWIDAHVSKIMEFEPAMTKRVKIEARADLLAMPSFMQIGGRDAGEVQFMKASLHDEDEDKRLQRFEMIGYSGGMMEPRGFGRIIIDISGMKIPSGAIPILKNHDPEQIVGHTTKIIAKDSLILEGVVSGAGSAAQEVIATSANGFPWQASVGTDINFDKISFLAEGDSEVINGQKQVGPVSVARESKLRETSFVPIGADSETSARVGENN